MIAHVAFFFYYNSSNFAEPLHINNNKSHHHSHVYNIIYNSMHQPQPTDHLAFNLWTTDAWGCALITIPLQTLNEFLD